MSPDSRRYALPAIVLHWLIAALIVLQVVLSSRMEGPMTPDAFAVTQLHKSVGVTILILSLARLAWRLLNPPPPMPATLSAWERRLARFTHAAFYGVMIGMPLTGWIMVSASQLDLPTLLYGVVPWPHLPVLPGLEPQAREGWRQIGETSHEAILRLAYVLVALHVAGALKHQLFSRDEPVLARMAPGARPGRWAEPRLLLIAAAFAGVVGFGLVVEPPHPGMSPPPAVVASGAGAAPNMPVGPAVPGQPSRWIVQPGSVMAFTSAWSGKEIQGRFDRWDADILFGPDALDGSQARVTIDLTSVNSGDAQRDAGVQAPDFFDVGAHPRAIFAADRFEAAGDGGFIAHGRLTLRGVSRPLDLPFTLKMDGDTAEVSGVTSLDRRTFGVGRNQWAQTDQIPAKVTIRISLKARRG